MKTRTLRNLAQTNTREFSFAPHVTSARESPFSRALLEEEKWLCIRVEQPMPDDFLAGKRVYIGPCLFPYHATHYLGPDAIKLAT
jgi:hypothetical protein